MGIFSSRIEYKFLEQCQKQLSQLDNSLTSLACSVDSVHGIVSLLLQQLEDASREGSENGHHARVISLTRDLLSSVEGSLYHEKMAFVTGLSQFVKVLINKSDNKQSMLRHLSTLEHLKIDQYLTDFQKKERASFNEAISRKVTSGIGAAGGSSVDPEGNKSLEDMQQEIEQLQKELGSVKQSSEEKIEKILVEKNKMAEENERLRNDLEKAQRRLEIVPVQIYCQRRGELMEVIEEELVTKLNDHLSSENIQLEITKCGTSAEIQDSKPLLVLCMSTSRIGTDAKNAIQGVQEPGCTALMIFHHKDQHALPSQSSDRVLASQEFKALSGIFDLAFLTGKGLYTCEMNTHAVTGIVDFVRKLTNARVRTENTKNKYLSR